jgi:predicted TIM-barrel fold metal-dependent hydrolase
MPRAGGGQGRAVWGTLPVVDAHVHAARLPTVKLDRRQWAPFASVPLAELYDDAGTIRPAAFDAYLEAEGVDVALLFAEYSPRVTGLQTVEDMLPLLEHNPARFRLVANVNPYYHHPVRDELDRQLGLGAVAVKVHPVHGAFPVNDRALYPAYARCEQAGVPVVVHAGTSTFPGAVHRYGDPTPVDDVLRDFPGLTVVLAHGGRGGWYDAAAFLAQSHPNVWIDIAGLPPHKLPDYYVRHDLARLAQRFLFGSDWPGVPGLAANLRAVDKLGLDAALLARVLAGNAARVFGLDLPG